MFDYLGSIHRKMIEDGMKAQELSNKAHAETLRDFAGYTLASEPEKLVKEQVPRQGIIIEGEVIKD